MNKLASEPLIRVLESLSEVPADQWNRLAGSQPFLRHEFLFGLEQTGCVSATEGWLPRHITLWQGEQLVGAMPLYLKLHSWGEFVFDWAWAEAYKRHGLDYYPKLVCSVPFTPVPGLRLLAESAADRALLARTALALAQESGVSSLHCLFPPETQARELASLGMMLRHGVQFHWLNQGFADFDAYLGAMSHAKRKKIKQERRKVSDAGIVFEKLTGAAITPAHWEFFHTCYADTYREHHSPPHLNLEFFRHLGATLADNTLLIIAYRAGQPIAGALNFFDEERLYGRHWGAIEYHPALHFEACYYQAIEFCIERGLQIFEGGAQGEHKLARGFLPVETWSAHWLAQPEFSRAVEQFLSREAQGMAQYVDELNERVPFKSENQLSNHSK